MKGGSGEGDRNATTPEERQLPEGLATAAEELPKVTRKTRLGLICLFSLAMDTVTWGIQLSAHHLLITGSQVSKVTEQWNRS